MTPHYGSYDDLRFQRDSATPRDLRRRSMPRPRLTTIPSPMSWAARQAACKRLSGCTSFPHRDDTVHKHARQLHAVMRNRCVEYGAHLGHGELRRHRHHRTEVHLRVAKREIAVAVGRVGANQGGITPDCLLQNVLATIEAAHLPATCEFGAEADGRIESRDAGTPSADAFGKGALRHALQIDLARHPQPLERRGLRVVAACGRAHDLAHETGFDQFVRERVAMRGRIDDQSQILRTTIAQGPDQRVGKAGAAEARNENRCSIRNISESRRSRIYTLVDWHAAASPSDI